jgi:hypothetical protein
MEYHVPRNAKENNAKKLTGGARPNKKADKQKV